MKVVIQNLAIKGWSQKDLEILQLAATVFLPSRAIVAL